MEVELLDAGARLAPGRAYHGIVPRGLVDQAPWWPGLAPVIEGVWNECAERPAGPHEPAQRAAATLRELRGRGWPAPAPTPSALTSAVEAARVAGVLSVQQAARAARDYLIRDDASTLRACVAALDGVDLLALDRVKEGHTATIFRVSVHRRGAVCAVFGLAVARDLHAAADELGSNARQLATWSRRIPGACAAVLGAGVGRCGWFGRVAEVPVVAMSWLEGHDELHVLRDRDGRGRVARVARFVGRPGVRLPQLDGEVLDVARSERTWASVVALRTRLAELDWQRDEASVPAIELNEGGVVGRPDGPVLRVALVGADEQPWRGALGGWLHEAALSQARADAGPLRWARPGAAVEAVLDAIDPGRRAELLARGQGATEAALRACTDEGDRALVAETARVIASRARGRVAGARAAPDRPR